MTRKLLLSLVIAICCFGVIKAQSPLALKTQETITKAIKGDVKAQDKICEMVYYDYFDRPSLNSENISTIQKLANKGQAWAQDLMGEIYHEQLSGFPKDINKAIELYQKSANQGYAWGLVNIGNVCIRQENYDKALEYYNKAADMGNNGAFNRLGDLYYQGIGVTKNKDTAIKWYLKAGDAGASSGYIKLAYLYLVAEDDNKAFEYCQKAAEMGYTDALWCLGLFYKNGIGVKEDEKQAFYWYKKAAEQGLPDAQATVINELLESRRKKQAALLAEQTSEFLQSYHKEIVLERKYKVHHGSNSGRYYSYPSISLIFDNNVGIRIGYINTYYYNTYLKQPYTGVRILNFKDIVNDGFTEHAAEDWKITSVVLDEWVEEKVIINLAGHIKYYMNGKFMGEKDLIVGSNLREATTVTVDVDPYGWWTGHYQYMDDFKIVTPATTISDNFNDGVIDQKIWKAPVNRDGVREEDGIIKMEQKRTDKDFHLRSLPIPLR